MVEAPTQPALRAIWCRGHRADGSRCKSMVAAYDEAGGFWHVKLGGNRYKFGVLIDFHCGCCGWVWDGYPTEPTVAPAA